MALLVRLLSLQCFASQVINRLIVEATFDHSYDRTLHPSPFILGSTITERQQASELSQSAVRMASY